MAANAPTVAARVWAARRLRQRLCLHRALALESLFTPCRGSSLVERGPEKAGVGGSIPSPGTIPSRFVSNRLKDVLSAVYPR
jgi:hypothetical protein